MARNANKKNKNKKQKFRDAKKARQRVKVQELTRIPKKQDQRWSIDPAPLDAELAETECDPDYVAFCITKQLDAWDEFGHLWLRIATALRLGTYTFKGIDRTGTLRSFDKDVFSKSIEDNEFEHEFGLRYEADKFLCYLLYGDHPRFRHLFAYILVPTIKNDLAADLSMMEYNQWIATEPTADLSKRLIEFDAAAVE